MTTRDADLYWEDDFRTTLKAVHSLDTFPKKEVACFVYDKICFVRFRRNNEGQAAEFDALVALAEFAKEARHEALRLGASSHSDPTWASAALIESWAVSKVGAIRQKFSVALPAKIERELMVLIDAELSSLEKRAFEEKIW